MVLVHNEFPGQSYRIHFFICNTNRNFVVQLYCIISTSLMGKGFLDRITACDTWEQWFCAQVASVMSRAHIAPLSDRSSSSSPRWLTWQWAMMTSSNGTIFRGTRLLALCAGNSPVTGEFPTQRPLTRSFDVFFDLHLNKRLNKQSWGWWFETPLHPLWRHSNTQFTHRNDRSSSGNETHQLQVIFKPHPKTKTKQYKTQSW